jgi:hypothetical protein
MCLIKIKIGKNKSTLLAKTIFGKYETLNQINEVNDHYKIIKHFFPNIDDNFKYDNFDVFPFFNNNFRINGIGENIKIICNDINHKIKTIYDERDLNAHNLIFNDFLKIFKNQIPYGIFYIYEIESILYLITTTHNNRIALINKSKTLDDLFNEHLFGKNLFNFQPLSEQGIKYIYYNDKITGVVNGIGKI